MSENKEYGNNKKIGWIQSLRAIAAIGVVVTHLYPVIKNTYGVKSNFFDFITIGLIDVGKIGVALFFILCGYFIFNAKNKNRKQFILGRIIRLYPEYWFSIVCAIIFIGGFSLVQIIANMTMLQMFLGQANILGLYWTLPIELTIYLLVYIFWKRIDDIRFTTSCYCVLIVINTVLAVVRYITRIPIPVAYSLLISLALLGFFCRLVDEKKMKKKSLLMLTIIWIIMMLIVSFLAYGFSLSYGETWYRYFFSYIMSFIIFGCMHYFKFSCCLLEKIGDMSYSIYLMHPIAYLLVLDNMGNSNWVIGLITSLVAIYLISLISYYIFEIKLTTILKNRRKIKIN